MFIRLRVTSLLLLVILVSTLMSGYATSTRQSFDIISHPNIHPAPIDNFQEVIPNEAYRSGQPIGEKQWDYLDEIEIKTVIKLNEFSDDVKKDDELLQASKRGINLIQIYMQPEDWPHNWNLFAQPEREDVNRAVEALANRGNKKVLVHCSAGKDRTGLVVATYKVTHENLCKEAAYEEMKFYGASSWLFGIKPLLFSEDVKENPNCNNEY